jgi:hypothetical protein
MRSIICTLGMVSQQSEVYVEAVANIRIDKPDELLESDSKYPSGHNPVIGNESGANK